MAEALPLNALLLINVVSLKELLPVPCSPTAPVLFPFVSLEKAPATAPIKSTIATITTTTAVPSTIEPLRLSATKNCFLEECSP
ncbi:MAG: hypothetical protein ACLU06_00335 [Eggerthellaceae bacterium]